MAKYECKVCGYIYNEQHASRSFEELTECPICNEGKENFVALDSDGAVIDTPVAEEIKEAEAAPEFVVERRQEFWSPIGNREETIVADEETKEEEKEEVADSSYGGRIESFYSSAEPVGMAHVISDEEEKEFKPLWNSAGGTVQRVIDPFGDRSEPLVKAEKIDMVMPAETPTVEEILGEEPEAADTVIEEPVVQTVAEEVFFAEEEETATEENVADAVVEEAVVEDVVENVMFGTVFEEEVLPEAPAEDFEAAEENESVATDDKTDAYFLDEEEDDDFFSEVVMDHFMAEEPVAEPVIEEVAEAVVEEPVTEEVMEEAAEEVIEEPVTEEVVEEAAEAVVEETVTEEVVEEVAEEVIEESVAEEAVEEIAEAVVEEPVAEQVEEAPRIKAWSFLDDVIEAGTVAGAGVAGAAVVSELAEEKEEVAEEVVEETVESEVAEPVKDDSYDFFTEQIRKAREAGGYTPLRVGEIDLHETYEDEEVVEEPAEEIIEEVIEEVAAEEAVEEVIEEEPVAEEKTYCNNLEKILILPAQLNPMPLPEAVEVDGRTVLGIGSDRPLVLDNPVFSTGEYNMVQYIPNSGLTSEDYQKADAIEIVVGKGNGIEKNINSKEDLRQVVNFLRLESDGCPIGIKLGAGRIERDLEFCIFAKPDYVVLNNFSVVPLPYALHRAAKFLNTVQSDIDVVIALDGVKDAEELAKIIAMGADVIALRNHPSNLDEMIKELKNHARVTGHYDVQDLNVKDLCTIDREIAEYTDIYHV